MEFKRSTQAVSMNIRQTGGWRLIGIFLAIVLGIGALVTAGAIAEGFYQTVNEVISGHAGKFMMVYPIQSQIIGQRQERILSEDDSCAIAGITEITTISCQKMLEPIPVKFRDQSIQATIGGTDPNYTIIRHRSLTGGRFINLADILNEERVCVITEDIQKKFFPARDFLEHSLEINGQLFRVVGCLQPMRLPSAFKEMNQERPSIYIPLSTCQSITRQNDCNLIWLSYAPDFESKKIVRLLKERIFRILEFRHGTSQGFIIKTFRDLTRQTKRRLFKVVSVLGGITAISLITGGIGIRKILSIHEINQNSFYPVSSCRFRLMALTMLGGGVVGLTIGFLCNRWLAVSFGMPTIFTWRVLLTGIMGTLATGFFLGLLHDPKEIYSREMFQNASQRNDIF